VVSDNLLELVTNSRGASKGNVTSRKTAADLLLVT